MPGEAVSGTVMVRVDVAEEPGVNVTLGGATDNVGPDGDTDAERMTVPEKPMLVTLIDGVAEEPMLILWGGAGTATLNALPTLTLTVVVF